MFRNAIAKPLILLKTYIGENQRSLTVRFNKHGDYSFNKVNAILSDTARKLSPISQNLG